MTTSSQQLPPQPPNTVDAPDLLPRDGQGSSIPHVIAEFDGQKKITSTKCRDLNPAWNEALEFTVSDPDNMDVEELETEVFNDRKFGNGSGCKSQFFGRVKLYGSQFAKRGEEGLVYFPLEKKSVFSWLRIYYYDEIVEDQPPPEDPPPQQPQQPPQTKDTKPTPGLLVEIIYW